MTNSSMKLGPPLNNDNFNILKIAIFNVSKTEDLIKDQIKLNCGRSLVKYSIKFGPNHYISCVDGNCVDSGF